MLFCPVGYYAAPKNGILRCRPFVYCGMESVPLVDISLVWGPRQAPPHLADVVAVSVVRGGALVASRQDCC